MQSSLDGEESNCFLFLKLLSETSSYEGQHSCMEGGFHIPFYLLAFPGMSSLTANLVDAPRILHPENPKRQAGLVFV